MNPRSVYIHIPFCTHKCHYCDFTAYVVGGQPVDAYLEALEREMAHTVEAVPPETIETLFIGGGTPTVLTPHQMEALLEAIRRHFPQWSPDLEFTVEANPGTIGEELLTVMKAGGVNRLSIGAQTFRSDLLERIGRVHSVDAIKHSVEQARRVGIENLSLDLMFGLPDQTVADMEDALTQALALEPDHFSVYSLKVEEGTLFHTQLLNGSLPLPSEDDELQMYQRTRKRLAEAGYVQYEVSNFSRVGRQSRHNRTYWLNLPYYGLGTGAHGYTQGRRHQNVKGVKEYIRLTATGLPIAHVHTVARGEEMENQLILGLRLMEGVSRRTFRNRFGTEIESVFPSVIPDLLAKGLILSEGERYRLTERGLLFGNDVFGAFLGEAA